MCSFCWGYTVWSLRNPIFSSCATAVCTSLRTCEDWWVRNRFECHNIYDSNLKSPCCSLGIQSYSQMMIGVSNHLLSIVFRFHYHSQKVIGCLGVVLEDLTLNSFFQGKNNQSYWIGSITSLSALKVHKIETVNIQCMNGPYTYTYNHAYYIYIFTAQLPSVWLPAMESTPVQHHCSFNIWMDLFRNFKQIQAWS